MKVSLERGQKAVRRRKRKEGNYLTSCGVVRSVFRAKRLGVLAGALLLGINSCIVPEQQTSFMRNHFNIFLCD